MNNSNVLLYCDNIGQEFKDYCDLKKKKCVWESDMWLSL